MLSPETIAPSGCNLSTTVRVLAYSVAALADGWISDLSKGLIVHPFGAVFAFFASIFTIRRVSRSLSLLGFSDPQQSIPATFLAIVLTALAFISTIMSVRSS